MSNFGTPHPPSNPALPRHCPKSELGIPLLGYLRGEKGTVISESVESSVSQGPGSPKDRGHTLAALGPIPALGTRPTAAQQCRECEQASHGASLLRSGTLGLGRDRGEETTLPLDVNAAQQILQTSSTLNTNLFCPTTSDGQGSEGSWHRSLVRLQPSCGLGPQSLKTQVGLQSPLPRSPTWLLAGGFCPLIGGPLHRAASDSAFPRASQERPHCHL